MNVVLCTTPTRSVCLYFDAVLAPLSEVITYFCKARESERVSEREREKENIISLIRRALPFLPMHMCIPYVIKLVNDIKPRQAIRANGGEALTAAQHK